ncbi:amylovoran biosynthesis protein AmsF [Erwinia sorbitola]|uniref:Amylovoran biosynthesis protein AmsF n=1 Tax=Erwinia sorbitola TaxID=2681984 RepID=A0A6I6ESB8_9GAMM|nr:amylovoran biosynthesis protein AmsF [Erwinia sorbitola]QGU87969.1 amylovoran biosynthesis protein AmsF [Erwinia sorbitola]
MIEVNSFAELRTTAPTKAGDIALLKRYYDKDSTFRGGGTFVGFITTALPVDDSGTYAVGTGFFWKRVVNSQDELNIYHFGGKGDGVTDDSGAFKQMLTWAQNVNTSSRNLGVRFPGGKFLINPIDLSASEIPFFYLYGDDNPQGGMPRTTIVSDKSVNPVFKVNARRTVIKGICWNGQASADITANTSAITAEMCTNQQPFFENIMVAGQTVLITCFRVQNNGGTAVKLLDTLDTKFDQIYSINTYARVFDVGWSDTVDGVWDHSTAIELSNANFQSGYGDATLKMPRVTQGVMRNVWIEHTRCPGDLSNGQWLVDALSLEDCANPFNMDNARVQVRQLNLQSGGVVSLNNAAGRWLSGYETGWRRDESFGTQMTGTMRAGWYSGYKITNTSTSDKWYKLGKVFMPKDNQQWMIEMIGKATTDAVSGTAGSPVSAISSGTSYLAISRCATAIYGDIRHHGSPAVLDIKFNRIGTTTSEIWVKLKAASGDTMFNLKSTGPTRFESGECSLFTPDLSEVTDLTTIGTVSPAARMSMHNGLAGIGANEKGVLTVATAVAAAPTTTTPVGYITVNVNGTDRKIAYY